MMPYVQVWVDDSDALEDMSTESLEKELESRRRAEGETSYISKRESLVSLDNASSELRKIGRNDLAYRLDEIRTDYFQ